MRTSLSVVTRLIRSSSSSLSSTLSFRQGSVVIQQQQQQHQCSIVRSIHIEKKLETLGITLPTAPTPKANYNIICSTNVGTSTPHSSSILYISGHLPIQVDGTLLTGRIGPESSGGLSIEHGYNAARYAGLNIIATLKEQLGDLDRVEQIIKVNERFSPFLPKDLL